MISLALLLAASLALVAFAGINLLTCIRSGISSAYGHAYSRAAKPIAFWISASCSGLGVLVGTALALAALTGLITR